MDYWPVDEARISARVSAIENELKQLAKMLFQCKLAQPDLTQRAG
jgi:hypothetical protein